MEKYSVEKALELIPQSAIKQCYVTDSPGYNACWDYHITPSGRHFLACCAEGAFPEYVRLYEYFPTTNTLEKKFNLDDKITVYPRNIRPSKLHTSMCSMPNGKIIMATHTTASAPTHKDWMPEAYYGHMWEGYMGSNVLIYDPDTNTVEDLGIPVPRESIYGAKYIPEHNCLFFITYCRGHAYRFDLDTRNVTDYGQFTEFGCYHIDQGPDGNLYFSSRTGTLWRLNAKTLEIEFAAEIPRDMTVRLQSRNVICYSTIGHDGKFYFCMHPSNHIQSYDPKTGKIETVANAMPKELRHFLYKDTGIFGLDIDAEGDIWYTYLTPFTPDPAVRIARLPISKGIYEPEDFGIVGTKEKVHVCVEGLYIRDEVAYLPDANGAYAPGVAAIDLNILKKDKDTARIYSDDPKFSREPYTEERFNAKGSYNGYTKNNPFTFRRDTEVYATKIWKALGHKDSEVRAVGFDNEGNAIAYIDKDESSAVTVRQGKILKVEKAPFPKKESLEEISAKFENYKLPSHPGRQFLAKASAYGEMENETTIVGTLDGGVALIKNGKVFSLGLVCNDGAVHEIAVSPDGKRAIGVAGDPDSLGLVFSFDFENGLTVDGFTYYSGGCSGDGLAAVSCEPCCAAFSPDGKRLAIGARDQLGTIYEYELES